MFFIARKQGGGSIVTSTVAGTPSSTSVSSISAATAASPYWFRPTILQRDESEKEDGTPAQGFSPIVAFCFTINYILGTGFLTLPWAFVQGGLALTAMALIAVGVVSDCSKDYLLETLARAEAMLDEHTMHWKTYPESASTHPTLAGSTVNSSSSSTPTRVPPRELVISELPADADERISLLNATASENGTITTWPANHYQATSLPRSMSALSIPSSSTTPQGSAAPSPNTSRFQNHRRWTKQPMKHRGVHPSSSSGLYQVRERKFEVNVLCRVFLGKGLVHVYTAFICLYCYCTLWAYTSVFASAMAKAAPWFTGDEDGWNYVMYTMIFATVVVPLSCLELNEQVTVQVVMTGCRFVMLFLMLATCHTVARDQEIEATYTSMENVEHLASIPSTMPPWLVNWAGLTQMLPIVAFAHIFHHSIPGLSHPVADKRKLGSIFRATVVFSTVAYTILGLSLAAVLGKSVEQSSNLNWKAYRGGTGTWEGQWVNVAWWARAISIYVVCFPALDVLSAFPLNAITLGNNMLGAFYGRKVHEAEQHRWKRTQFRLLASLPPILLAVWVRQLGTITDYAGTTGFVIGFSFPALLYLRSRWKAQRRQFPTTTWYSSYGSNPFVAWVLFGFGIAMVAYVAGSLALQTD